MSDPASTYRNADPLPPYRYTPEQLEDERRLREAMRAAYVEPEEKKPDASK